MDQAAHNYGLATYLRGNRKDCLDWAATCLFYAAIHYINAYLTKKGLPMPRKHRGDPGGRPGRSDVVRDTLELHPIYAQYRALDDESRDARYELKRPKETDFDSYLLPQLDKIRLHINPIVTS